MSKMVQAFLRAFGGEEKKKEDGFEKMTLLWMKDRGLRRLEKAEGWVRVSGLGGKVLFEGFVWSTSLYRVYGRDAHITVFVKPYAIKGRASSKNLGRVESVLFLGLERSEIEQMISEGECPNA